MNLSILEKFREHNQLFKEFNLLYRDIGLYYGLSETAMLILYSLKVCEQAPSQKEICEMWCQSKQTINSALKKLESSNFIKMQKSKSIKEGKKIYATDLGLELIKNKITPILNAELNAFSKFSNQEMDIFMELSKRNLQNLRDEFNQIMKENINVICKND